MLEVNKTGYNNLLLKELLEYSTWYWIWNMKSLGDSFIHSGTKICLVNPLKTHQKLLLTKSSKELKEWHTDSYLKHLDRKVNGLYCTWFNTDIYIAGYRALLAPKQSIGCMTLNKNKSRTKLTCFHSPHRAPVSWVLTAEQWQKKHSLVNNKGKESCRHQEPGLTIDIGCSYRSTLGIYIGSPWHLIKRAVAGQLRLWLPHHLCTSVEGTAWRSFEHAYPD